MEQMMKELIEDAQWCTCLWCANSYADEKLEDMMMEHTNFRLRVFQDSGIHLQPCGENGRWPQKHRRSMENQQQKNGEASLQPILFWKRKTGPGAERLWTAKKI